MDLVRAWLQNWNRFKWKIKVHVGGIGSSAVAPTMSMSQCKKKIKLSE